MTQQRQNTVKKKREIQKVSIPIDSSQTYKPIPQIVPVPKKMKMKIQRYPDSTAYAKVLVEDPMFTVRVAQGRGVKQEYITRIVAKENNKIVFDLISTEYLSRNPFMEFAYKSLGASSLNIETTDNSGHKENLTQIIRDHPKPRSNTEINTTRKDEEPHRANIPAIIKTFGDIELIDTDRIQLLTPNPAMNSVYVDVNVHSDIKAKSVTLFAMEENEQMKFICQWRIDEHSIIDYHIKIKLQPSNNNDLKIILEGTDGKFYAVEKKVETATQCNEE